MMTPTQARAVSAGSSRHCQTSFMAPHQAKPNRFANLPTVNGTVITASRACTSSSCRSATSTRSSTPSAPRHHRLVIQQRTGHHGRGPDARAHPAVDLRQVQRQRRHRHRPDRGHHRAWLRPAHHDRPEQGRGRGDAGQPTARRRRAPPHRSISPARSAARPRTCRSAWSTPARCRPSQAPMPKSGLADHGTKHNMVFLAEGYRAHPADRDLFDGIVEKAANDLLENHRHEPYPMLASSSEHLQSLRPVPAAHADLRLPRVQTPATRTCRSQAGLPIPYNGQIDVAKTNIYAMDELIQRVGLPMRGREPAEPARAVGRPEPHRLRPGQGEQPAWWTPGNSSSRWASCTPATRSSACTWATGRPTEDLGPALCSRRCRTATTHQRPTCRRWSPGYPLCCTID